MIHRMARVVSVLALGLLASFTPSAAQDGCRRVVVDERAIHACVSGSGPVTVVLAAGAGQGAATWPGLVPSLEQEARFVTFDRPGIGASDPGPKPRTPTRIANEIHQLLEGLDVDGPLVLVGHSMGGIHMLRYAASYPDDVSAVVLLDTPPPDFEAERLLLLTPAEREERARLLERGATNAPPIVRLEREGARDPAEWDFPDFPEELPLTVVVANAQYFGELGSNAEHRALWATGSRAWTRLSTRSEYVVAEGSGHMVHHDAPELVLELLRAHLRAARGGGDPLPIPRDSTAGPSTGIPR